MYVLTGLKHLTAARTASKASKSHNSPGTVNGTVNLAAARTDSKASHNRLSKRATRVVISRA